MSKDLDKTLVLNKLMKHYGFRGNTEFANFLGIKPQTVSSWFSRNTYDTELLYAKCVNIDAHFLLTGEEPIEKPNIKDSLYNESITKSITISDNSKSEENVIHNMPTVVTVDQTGNDNVVLVSEKAAAGYLAGYGDPEYIETLPAFRLPNINNGTFRMFQVDGHSMYPTITNGSYVVGEWVEDWYGSIKDNRIYVIVSDKGVLIKRVLNRLKKYQNLYLKSDNRKEYPNIPVLLEEIKEVWAVKMHLGFELPDPSVLYDRVSDLEAEFEQIKQLLKTRN
jgi:phage repressor protein C with HTH and peptisase S24 domain